MGGVGEWVSLQSVIARNVCGAFCGNVSALVRSSRGIMLLGRAHLRGRGKSWVTLRKSLLGGRFDVDYRQL